MGRDSTAGRHVSIVPVIDMGIVAWMVIDVVMVSGVVVHVTIISGSRSWRAGDSEQTREGRQSGGYEPRLNSLTMAVTP